MFPWIAPPVWLTTLAAVVTGFLTWLGLTPGQYLSIAGLGLGVWILRRLR